MYIHDRKILNSVFLCMVFTPYEDADKLASAQRQMWPKMAEWGMYSKNPFRVNGVQSQIIVKMRVRIDFRFFSIFGKI